MAWLLFDASALNHSMLPLHRMDLNEQTATNCDIFIKTQTFSFEKMFAKPKPVLTYHVLTDYAITAHNILINDAINTVTYFREPENHPRN